MIQEIREKIFHFKLGKAIQIDNMNFKIKEMYVHWDENTKSCSVSIWGNKPHATTISTDRIVRLENLLWRPRTINFSTEKNYSTSPFCTEKKFKSFIELQEAKKDKVVSITVEMDTMLNSTIVYIFD